MPAGADPGRCSGNILCMIESRYPNRWFGSNPQAIANQGKKLSAFDRSVPKTWRSALGLPDESTQDAAPASEAAADE